MRPRLLLVSLPLVLSACAVSPEAARVRGGGPGADIGNHGVVVQIHGRVDPGHNVPAVGKSAVAGDGTASTTNSAKTTATGSR